MLEVLELVAAVEGLRAGRKDFDDEFWVAFDVAILAIAKVAGDEGVGVVVEVVSVVDFDVAVVETTGGVAEVEVDETEEIDGDTSVVVAAACHGIDEAVAIFVTDGILALEGEIVLGTDVVRSGDHFGDVS